METSDKALRGHIYRRPSPIDMDRSSVGRSSAPSFGNLQRQTSLKRRLSYTPQIQASNNQQRSRRSSVSSMGLFDDASYAESSGSNNRSSNSRPSQRLERFTSSGARSNLHTYTQIHTYYIHMRIHIVLTYTHTHSLTHTLPWRTLLMLRRAVQHGWGQVQFKHQLQQQPVLTTSTTGRHCSYQHSRPEPFDRPVFEPWPSAATGASGRCVCV